ncbi:MAG TPA: hypothetical protein VFH63_02400 [candidate division Zixibacteria bacterium]|nr:hypothetical protein [candidate division Zixibacteria bacterium]
MSRAERRAYKRMMKNADPFALPPAAGARARAMQARAARRQRGSATAGSTAFWSRRMVTWTVVGALVIGLLAFSIAWERGMPTALYAGLIGAAVWAALAVAFRAFTRRSSAPPAR